MSAKQHPWSGKGSISPYGLKKGRVTLILSTPYAVLSTEQRVANGEEFLKMFQGFSDMLHDVAGADQDRIVYYGLAIFRVNSPTVQYSYAILRVSEGKPALVEPGSYGNRDNLLVAWGTPDRQVPSLIEALKALATSIIEFLYATKQDRSGWSTCFDLLRLEGLFSPNIVEMTSAIDKCVDRVKKCRDASDGKIPLPNLEKVEGV